MGWSIHAHLTYLRTYLHTNALRGVGHMELTGWIGLPLMESWGWCLFLAGIHRSAILLPLEMNCSW